MQTPHSSPEDVQRFMQKGKWLGNLECYTQMCWQLLSLICLLLQLKLTLNHSYESARLSFKIMVAFYLWTLCGNICAVTGTFHSNNALTFYNFATLNLTWSCACVCMCVCVCVCVRACPDKNRESQGVSMTKLAWMTITGTITVHYCKSAWWRHFYHNKNSWVLLISPYFEWGCKCEASMLSRQV